MEIKSFVELDGRIHELLTMKVRLNILHAGSWGAGVTH
jgi:hypothetical protein